MHRRSSRPDAGLVGYCHDDERRSHFVVDGASLVVQGPDGGWRTVSEVVSGVPRSAGRGDLGGGAVRHHLSAGHGQGERRATGRLPRDAGDPGRHRRRSPGSWQGGRPGYSYATITVSIGLIVCLTIITLLLNLR